MRLLKLPASVSVGGGSPMQARPALTLLLTLTALFPVCFLNLQGHLQQMFEVFEFMRGHGRRPGPETCYILVKGCVDHGRPDLAEVRLIWLQFLGSICLVGRVGICA